LERGFSVERQFARKKAIISAENAVEQKSDDIVSIAKGTGVSMPFGVARVAI
jgi:hypothetical protein